MTSAFNQARTRRHRKVAAYCVFGVFIIALMGWRIDQVVKQHAVPIPIADALVAADENSQEVAAPIHIRVPAVGIDAAFEGALGLRNNYEIQVPEGYEAVGYYKHGPLPGELGPAVVLGHVDSLDGPAVFYPLRNVEIGDVIEIDREDGTTAVFEIENIEQHSQAGFPTEKVYSDLEYEGLRLITCSGTFNHGVQRYSHNLIVFAKLIEVQPTNSA